MRVIAAHGKRRGRVLAWSAGVVFALGGVGALRAGSGPGDEVFRGDAGVAEPASSSRLEDDVVSFFEAYCTSCHDRRRKRAGLALDEALEGGSVLREREVFEKVERALRSRKMPPERREQPTETERLRVAAWIRAELDRFDCSGPVDPGRVTIRRLNRTEYDNTVRDLAGVDFHPSDSFPADDIGYGFDNIGDVLSLPPLLFEKYIEAADQVIERATAKGTPSRAAIFLREPDSEHGPVECAREILARFATRAYRRPLREGELDRLVAVADRALVANDGFEEAVKVALKAVLVSPHFLFRLEADPLAVMAEDPDAIVPLGSYALASRLSYFLWSTMPDDELFRLAAEDRLQEDAVLREQVQRMLADPRSRAFVENFAGQWLGLRRLEAASPDPGLFPTFDDALRTSMQTETYLLFEAVLGDNRSLLDLIASDYSFLNERLARHYGVEGVDGADFRRVSLRETSRGGVLTHASILTITSNPNRTSPVKRGLWILEQILGAPPPPPPPDVPELSEEKGAILSGSLRERFERHREDPDCAACHERMDPLGFALEHFDAVGAWRDKDGQFEIDASGQLPDGSSFEGASGLREILLERKDEVTRALAEKMLTYAMGRGLEFYDKCAVDRIVEAVTADGYRLQSMVVAVVQSDPFRKRRGGTGRP